MGTFKVDQAILHGDLSRDKIVKTACASCLYIDTELCHTHILSPFVAKNLASFCLYSTSLPFASQMEEDDQKELQLLPAPHSAASSSNVRSVPSESSSRRRSAAPDPCELAPSLDLQLSISLRPIRSPPNGAVSGGSAREYGDMKLEATSVKALKWEAGEQIRLAAIEKAYAERVKELTRREMELAQSEFARARHMWERAREEVDRAERMKERATRQVDSTCMEITCQSCRQRFRPA